MPKDNRELVLLIRCLASELTPERIAAEYKRQVIINKLNSLNDKGG